jgi:hypothetical protein
MMLSALLLAGCATKPVPARIVTVTPEIPPDLLTCSPAPAVPVATRQAQVADYIVNLWQAGQDCRAHVQAIKAAVAK